MATAVAYNHLHNSSVGMGGAGHHPQLARSLERILEDAHFSGELILTNRKLKDFPKSSPKYDLHDTVIADLSRNRFCELPEEITTFSFLETLLLYHNSIRSIPESLKRLSSLTYLDIRNNQLSCLPREICLIPLQVLLVSNNRLTSLPDELGRMDRLTDLDVSYNLLTSLPARIGELHSLRSFSLRNNQLMYLPRELSCLSLITLDVANNRIASLPLEIRQMSSLVVLNLENNPLTMPPASLCVRGLVHVFKFLETQVTRDVKTTAVGGNYDGYTTLRRAPRNNSNTKMVELTHGQRFRTELGYNTCEEKTTSKDNVLGKVSLTSNSAQNSDMLDASLTSSGSTIIDESSSDVAVDQDQIQEIGDNLAYQRKLYVNQCEKANKNLDKIQTYKEFKEALKQQRNHDIFGVYKVKGTEQDNKFLQNVEQNSESEIPNGTNKSESNNNKFIVKSTINKSLTGLTNGICISPDEKISNVDFSILPIKPIQKVKPSRNTDYSASQKANEESEPLITKSATGSSLGDCIGYVKPNSPMKTVNANSLINMSDCVVSSEVSTCVGRQGASSSANLTENNTKLNAVKANRTVTWNQDVPSELLSFTMRREFDRQREETELLTELRNIIETRLKMTLPNDIASALADGVILCHLANYVRPRSVASIHVPSPGVSKLTMARCRKNVDNFLEACRKIGVEEELICSYVDVLHGANKETCETSQAQGESYGIRHISPSTSAVFKTILALIAMVEKPKNSAETNNFIKCEKKTYKSESNLHYGKKSNENGVCSMQRREVLNKEQETTATCTKQIISHKSDVPLKSILKNRDITKFSDEFGQETIDFVGNNNEKMKDESNLKSKQNIGDKPQPVKIPRVFMDLTSLPLHAHKTQYIHTNDQRKHRELNEVFDIEKRPQLTNIFKQKELPLLVHLNKEANYVVNSGHDFSGQDNDRQNKKENCECSETTKIVKSAEITEAIQSQKKVNIFSIYRMLHVSTNPKADKIVFQADKDEITYDDTYDSNMLTALLSCLFIFSVLLLTFFPLSV